MISDSDLRQLLSELWLIELRESSRDWIRTNIDECLDIVSEDKLFKLRRTSSGVPDGPNGCAFDALSSIVH